jgi:EmrB/QacA subfamily drug resistance transporter
MTNTSAQQTSVGPDATGDTDHRMLIVILSGLMLVMFLASLDQTVVATALPTIAGDFHRTDLLSWVVTAYLLASTASTPLYGKAGDLYGRKRVLQFAVVVFLAGSAACGLAQSMYQLIAFRGIQGLGAGGLISLVLAIIGDLVPPRERGKYQGYFAGVFGVSSVLGPLVGGFLVDQASWRWIFYVNLPFGLVALVVINRVLHLPKRTTQTVIDWAGAVLVAAGVSAILLGAQSGGRDYAWGSWQVIGLFVGGVGLLGLFVLREFKAREPILPMGLFRNATFRVCALLSFISAIGMFGVITFLPQYMQIVRGDSATASGLLTLPLLVGLLTTSIISGRLTSRLGRYRFLVIFGTAVMPFGLLLLARISHTSSYTVLALGMLVFGIGLGSFMQVLTLAVQNGVERKYLGVGTSSVTFFRSMGGAIGASVFGALLTARLEVNLPKQIPGFKGNVKNIVASPDAVKALPAAVQNGLHIAYSDSLSTVFLVAIPVLVVAFVISLFLKDVKLRTDGPAPASALD